VERTGTADYLTLRAGTVGNPSLHVLAYSLFFVFGSVTSLNDVLMPKLKELFHLNYAEMTLVQFCFFTSYALVSIPASYLIDSISYVRSVVVGLTLMAAGCLLFLPAAQMHSFGAFLGALFIIAAGVTVVQVSANPFVMALGSSTKTARRLTLAHACNSIGTVVAPFLGSILILGVASGSGNAPPTGVNAAEPPAAVISSVYLGIAAILLVVAFVAWTMRNGIPRERVERRGFFVAFELLRIARVRFGVAAMFLYVGAEVAIGSLLVNYLSLPTTLNLSAETAGKHLTYYWGGLLVGRLCGLVVLRFVSASRLLVICGSTAIGLVLISICTTGGLSAWSLLAVGLCNSIMFPLIFDLTAQDLKEKTSEASGLICVAIAGGAFVPLLTGRLADLTSLGASLIVPAACYIGIAAFGWSASRRA